MNKWGIFRTANGSKYICRIIDNVSQLDEYPHIKMACKKFGEKSILPVTINSFGGWCPLAAREEVLLKTVESVNEPSLTLEEHWPKNNPDFCCGFVSPEGDTYCCGEYQHLDLAEAICQEFYNSDNKPEALNVPDDKIVDKGWVKVLSDRTFWGNFKLISDKQLKILESLNIQPGKLLKSMLEYRDL